MDRPGSVNGPWRQLLCSSVSPLEEGVGALQVEVLRATGFMPGRPARTAAVLVGILEFDAPEILLTRRARHLVHHPGQISFPGGAAEQGGETGVLTALREAEEEIGLSPSRVQPIGFLDRVDTVSDFRVLPVVGLVSQAGPWVPDGSEVDEVFTLPLELALDLGAYQDMKVERDGNFIMVRRLEYQDRVIWGVTAAILHNLASRVAGEGALI